MCQRITDFTERRIDGIADLFSHLAAWFLGLLLAAVVGGVLFN